jgi:hypothetical protein
MEGVPVGTGIARVQTPTLGEIIFCWQSISIHYVVVKSISHTKYGIFLLWLISRAGFDQREALASW